MILMMHPTNLGGGICLCFFDFHDIKHFSMDIHSMVTEHRESRRASQLAYMNS